MAIDCVGVKEGHGVTKYNMILIKEAHDDRNAEKIRMVAGVLVEGSRDIQTNWKQPFENESIGSLFQKVGGAVEKSKPESKSGAAFKLVGNALESNKPEALLQNEGGTFGKHTYHSRQVWEGNQPHSFHLQIGFFAQDSQSQVSEALQRLEEWICPDLLDKSIVGQAPQIVVIRYPGMIFTNCIIKSMSTPVTQPKLAGGHMLFTTVSLQVETIQMINRSEIGVTF